MSDSNGSEAPPPTYQERLVQTLGKRINTALFSDLITKEILENCYLKRCYYRHVIITCDDQARALVFTFMHIIKSIANTHGIVSALLSLTRVLVGGRADHVATSVDGYFILLSAFNLRLHVDGNEKTTPVSKGDRIHPWQKYTLKRIDTAVAIPSGMSDPSQEYTLLRIDPTLLDTATLPECGRIEIAPLVEFWYNLAWKDGEFNIGDFVNNLCGAVGMSILEDKNATTTCKPDGKGSKADPMLIGRRAISSVAGYEPFGLPPLHLLSIP